MGSPQRNGPTRDEMAVMVPKDGKWPPGKMYVRMKSECVLQYAL